MDAVNEAVTWGKPVCGGSSPGKRAGHTLSLCGSAAYLFGGGPSGATEPTPTNELFRLEMSSPKGFHWQKVSTQGCRIPQGRSQHTASCHNNSIIVFGGFKTNGISYNDVWVLDTNTDTWTQPHPGITDEMDDGTIKFREPWNGCPEPRGGHSSCVVDNSLIVFGGYGGYDFCKGDFNDVHLLDLDTWEWRAVATSGELPEPRSGHQVALVKRKLYVCGGWNSADQFDDLYVLDIDCWTWEKLGVGWGVPRWNHSTVGVFAVPYWKVFVFGGNSGDLTSGVGNMQGEFLGDLCVLDTGSNTWSQLQATGNQPCPRADTEIIYDPDLNRLILFGGWANNWFEELCVCDVGGVVGPPYALESISPSTGPITGENDTVIRGVGFQSSTGIPTIRLSCSKGFLEVKGEVLSDSELRFSTPRFDKYGPVEAEVRVSIGNKSLTNTSVVYTYFSVCDGTQTIAFGPGILKGFIACKPVEFMIQARDKAGNPRICGGDEFEISITPESGDGSSSITSTITDMGNGTYTATYIAPYPGKYSVSVRFTGTFGGTEGEIRGSPFLAESITTSSVDSSSPTGTEEGMNRLGGSLHLAYLQQVPLELKSTSSKAMKGISQSIPEDSRQVLIDVRKHLKFVDEHTGPLDLSVDASRAALGILKQTNKFAERILNGLESSATAWNETKKTASNVSDSIVHLTKVWARKTEEEITAYEVHVKDRERDFRKCEFWSFDAGPDGGRRSLKIMEADIEKQTKVLESKSNLCDIFNFPQAIATSAEAIDKMKSKMSSMYELWNICKGLQLFISESKSILWREVSFDDLEETAKKQMKAVRGLHKDVRDSSAYMGIEKLCKDFLLTIPLISLLGHEAMRRRHWTLLQKATGKSFRLPEDCPDLRLDDLLSLNLHELSADVEDIADQAAKEAKIESTLEQLSERWKLIEWLMECYPGTDIPLLKIGEEDFETLESDQLTIQGMLGSRYVKQFETEATKWKKSLGTIAELIGLLWRVQQIWSYLEPLFIHSEEVKKELPEDAIRFEGINSDVCTILRALWCARNIRNACNTDGYVLELEKIAEQLESLKSSLAEFLDGRRRLFPRYYFVSESDLLDILSNGSTPEKVLIHIPKVYLQTKTLVLSDTKSETNRPSALKLISGVGVEEMEFEPPVPLEGKVEKYMKDVLDGMKISLFENVKRSLVRYTSMSRPDWIMHKNPVTGRPSDPAQVILLTLAIYYAREVEEALARVESGDDASALQKYNQIQQDQLSDLVRLTQSDLSKADRTRVMVCITMDAHGRDVVQKMIREKVTSVSDFQWQSQLKHKWRIPPQGAGFQLRDPHLRGPQGERAEIAIADAILPYDYEYLGNGLRLVITPLTDRIYVTATQALNLKMGCAPAGPAGTGKTETTKDLANALAKCCYVFNCSPEMDYKGLGNIFKGLSSSGAWGCFDEFNRLIPEVLSVCSVQFKAVCDGVRGEVSRITVEGDEITLDPTCGVFITMNPGYLGRSELPEGLKALFRPMTVMVPDLVLICENMLMSEGFVTAKVLASKFYGLYSLLRELLSKQMHYDWGLRAVKSVLVVAGAFKRAEPDLPEDTLLMRALRDFNTPKIVQEDQVVFFGLLDDLFPGINPPRKVDESLETHVKNACTEMGKHPGTNFCLKVAQLDELLAIRHCVFIMGPPGAGKSQCWKTLAAAQAMRDPSLVTKIMDINPKSIQTEELYGYISMATREWKDGLLSHIMRDLGNVPDEKPKWILLDGDLDANWIESMNSVMDDNRMLTLASNERIPLKSHMRMIFEIRDLKYATPATVSRAGILYISTDEGTQWKALIESWLVVRKEPPTTVQALRGFFEQYMARTLLWMKIHVKTVVPIEDVNIVQVLLYMLDSMLDELKHVPTPEMLERVFVFCTVWAFGSTLTTGDDGTDYRKIFSDWWRTEWTKIKFPSRETVFDYWLDYSAEHSSFEQWTKSPHFYSIEFDSRSMAMESVTVPTPETCSVTFWMQLLVNMRRPVMMVGPSGTGKTQMAKGMLQLLQNEEGRGSQQRGGVPDEVLSQAISFNFYTTSAALQRNMNLPLERKTGTSFGPPRNARLVYFLDDINLPEVDPYNTQSAIALLRQHLEYEHVYDLSKMSVQNISNTQILACLNPTAGSFLVNPRLQRWFATFAVGLPGPTSLLTIYETFLNGHLKHFDPSIAEKGSSTIKAALGLHAQVTTTFRKTATNFHYEFNIRHLSSVFQGLLVAQPAQFADPKKFIQLWLHESERVYGDRLVSLEELAKYNSLAQAQCKKQFPTLNVSRFYAEQNADPLIFCHFAEGVTEQAYEAVESMSKLSKVLEDSLREYNEVNVMMDLVLFEDAIKHVARIVRIMHNEGGHALLVGVGGSGKQSLARLAAFICGYSAKQIAISSTYSLNDFKDDLKAMYNLAGVRDEGIMFLFTDSQITNEKFLVFINDLLATGEVPDLFTTEETDTIINAMTQKVKSKGLIPDRKNCWELFIHLVRKNLHVVLAFSPVGNDFRNRARKFPAIVSCTVIDWFQPWPQDALFSVGKKFLADLDLGSDTARGCIESFLPFSFEAVNVAARRFLQQEKRAVYTTPKSFLELLKLYRVLLASKRDEQEKAILRLDNGLLKLKVTKDAVSVLEEDLKVKLENAEQKRSVAEGIAEAASKEKTVVEVETKKAQVEAEEVARIQTEVSIKQKDTEEDLAKAEPAVQAAMAALDTVNRKDLAECRTMSKPPAGVEDIFAATMILLAGNGPSVVVTKTGKVKDRSWDASKKQLLGDVSSYIDLLKGLKNKVDSNSIAAINWKEIRPLLELEHFNVPTISAKNSAAAGLCEFVLNIVQYHDIVITVEPKRKALADANNQLQQANSRLTEVQSLVAELESELEKLTIELKTANKEKQEALDSVAQGQRKLELAQRLISALASENDRWAENVSQLKADSDLLTGDVLLAASFISYIGPFTKPFRDGLLDEFLSFLRKEFSAACETELIPLSTHPDPVRMLTTDAEIADWNTDALPADRVSTENGCIVCNSARWPLIVDPQLQGIQWIKDKESSSERNLEVVRLGQSDMLRKLERALENGYSILIENLGETIEATLYPVIQRAAVHRGRKMFLKLGDTEVEFHPNFRLFLHTKLSNPHYPPEIQAETTLINFTVTEKGLEDQLLNLVMRKERQDLADLGEQLVAQQNGFKIKVKELEDNILFKLAEAQGDITEDVELIEGLEETKRMATDIQHKAALATATQETIRATSEKYRPVAERSSLLFFLLNDLVKVHTYYIYSLDAFSKIFYQGIDLVSSIGEQPEPNVSDESMLLNVKSDTKEENDESGVRTAAYVELSDKELSERCDTLITSISRTVFGYVRRGLFEVDKLTVSAMLSLKVAVSNNELSQKQVEFLLDSKVSMDPGNLDLLSEWLPEMSWKKLKALEELKQFRDIGNAFHNDSDNWLAWFDSEKPESACLPGEYKNTLSQFDRLTLIRALRPDRISTALAIWIESTMGEFYVHQEPFNMEAAFLESTNSTPIFFVLFPGVDPTPWVEELGLQHGVSKEKGNFINISMGQGQEVLAEDVIKRFSKTGGWVMLQNCHLMQSWVPVLERLLEVVTQDADPSFRCFISAEPPSLPTMRNMPESLMQSCIKVANEAPADIMSNFSRAWANFTEPSITECKKPNEYRACLFALCWFHSIVLGRRRFGQQGWSRNYSFNMGDLTVCGNVLKSYVNDNESVPWEDLRYIFGEIIYGGHVTDTWDRRTNNTYLDVLFHPGIFENAELGPGFKSPIPGALDYHGYAEYVAKELPSESPALFGLHPNAEIGYLTHRSESLFSTIAAVGGSAKNDGIDGSSSTVSDTIQDLLERLPSNFEMISIGTKAKALLDGVSGPFVIVVLQECTRMNVLLTEIRNSLMDLDKGLKGQLNMSQAMEDLVTALSSNQWPGRDPFSLCNWDKLAWPSNKSLAFQFMDMLSRVEQLKSWTEELITPHCLWLPGLFNPTSYLTAVMQVTARSLGLPLDKMTTETHVTIYATREAAMAANQPKDGVFVDGLFIEGARWASGDEAMDVEMIEGIPCAGHLADSRLKELLPSLPVIYIRAVSVQPEWEASSVGYLKHNPSIYDCPVYFTRLRGPTYVSLATLKSIVPTSKWTLTGTAIIFSTDE